ncbi:hypothetical protein BC834DRAFT_846829 [Gloeopeniophorella convolvens]|nr:hypothetical protein BC834DRAFT_846829 [Gloeopeniophorella convolvens]
MRRAYHQPPQDSIQILRQRSSAGIQMQPQSQQQKSGGYARDLSFDLNIGAPEFKPRDAFTLSPSAPTLPSPLPVHSRAARNASGVDRTITMPARAQARLGFETSIDCLNLESYAKPDHWFAEFGGKIEGILLQQLKYVIQIWYAEFDRPGDDDDLLWDVLPSKRRGNKQRGEKLPEDSTMLKPIVHEIRIQNQVIFFNPPAEYSSRYEIELQIHGVSTSETLYTSLMQFTDDVLQWPFALTEAKVHQLKDCVGKYLQFQSLWYFETEYVLNRLGDSRAQLTDARTTFEMTETPKAFGVCVVDYEQVQARVNAQYDAWQRDILSRFGVKLGNATKEMYAAILKLRNDLEHHSIEGLVGATRHF